MRRTAAVLLIVAGIVAGWLCWSTRTPSGPERLTGAGTQYSAEVTLDKARPGVVDADIFVTGSVDAVWLSAVMPEMGHATPEIPAQQRKTGRFHARGELFTMPGAWELTVRVEGAAGPELITVKVLVEG
jgi:hypothetical protein